MSRRYRNIRAFSLGVIAGGLGAGAALAVVAAHSANWSPYLRHSGLVLISLIAIFSPASTKYHETPGWLPNPRRQVPLDTARRGASGLATFGIAMGLGIRTFVTARSPYVVAVLAALGYIGVSGALCAGAGFGIGRLVPVVAAVAYGERGLIRLAEATPTTNSLTGRAVALIAAMSLASSLLPT